MAKYSAINIGPIVKTLGMARKPRELWAASYMFSYLMSRIVDVLKKKEFKIISPATPDENASKKFGLYPDRVYFEGVVDPIIIEDVVNQVSNEIKIDKDYFNVMICTTSANSANEAIVALNKKADLKELFVKATTDECEKKVRALIKKKYGSPLFPIALEGLKKYDIDTIEEIAKGDDSDYSYTNYFCVVQADGDCMGTTIASADEETIKKISEALLAFGTEAIKKIDKYADKTLPLYAGGDDLLFIVPVVGKNSNIFDLIKEIDEIFADKVKAVVSNTSMSYGVSINYCKYPLYEALEEARHQLFDVAKHVPGKNALAWDFRKHSGGAFTGAFSKDSNSDSIYSKFLEIIKGSSVNESVVSSVSHKIRNNESLLGLWADADPSTVKIRNAAFFERYMDRFDRKNVEVKVYKQACLDLLNACYLQTGTAADDSKTPKKRIESIVQNMYGILRTAKFVKGENQHEQ